MRFAVLVIGLLALTGCASTPIDPGLPLDLTLAPGERADVQGQAVRLRFDAVIGDSRCPADALCIQGGDAIVRIVVMPNAGTESPYDLHTGSMQPIRYRDLTIALVELNPYPFSGRTIAQTDYRARFRISR